MTPKELAQTLAAIAKAMGWSVAIIADEDSEGAVIGTPEFLAETLGDDVEYWSPKASTKITPH